MPCLDGEGNEVIVYMTSQDPAFTATSTLKIQRFELVGLGWLDHPQSRQDRVALGLKRAGATSPSM